MSTQTLDTAALEKYLDGRLPGFSGGLRAEKFAGGQSNPTFLLESGDQRWVLRRKPPGELLASAHAVDREYRVLSALRDTRLLDSDSTGPAYPAAYALLARYLERPETSEQA